MKTNVISLVVLALCGVLWGCNSDETKSSRLEVRLTDAPGEYQEVNIDIQDVQVSNGTSDDNGWTSLQVNKGVYNLLQLSNGLDTLLGTIDLPAGKIEQIRLILGPNNSIKLNGDVLPLNTPSAQQSGLKIQVNTELKEGVTYKILLDFDAARSIVSAGASGKFNLKPVIRSFVEAETGAIKGVVVPIESTPVVYALVGADTVATAIADQVTGKFLIKGLGANNYKVIVYPKTGYQTFIQENVAVTIGNVTDIGTITIQK
jgi:hypothetical protein